MPDLTQLAQKADRLYVLREQRLAAQKVVDEMQAEESAITKELIDAIDKTDAQGVVGKKVRITVVVKPEPTVEDWDKFFDYVASRRQFDLLQKRISPPAIRARWEDGKEIPGVGTFNVVKLSMHKV